MKSAYFGTEWCCSWRRKTRDQFEIANEAGARHVRRPLRANLSASLSSFFLVPRLCKCGALVRRGMARIAATGTWHGCRDTSPHVTPVARRGKCGNVALVLVLLVF